MNTIKLDKSTEKLTHLSTQGQIQDENIYMGIDKGYFINRYANLCPLAIKYLDEQAIITEELIDFISPAFLEIRKEIIKSNYLLIRDLY